MSVVMSLTRQIHWYPSFHALEETLGFPINLGL